MLRDIPGRRGFLQFLAGAKERVSGVGARTSAGAYPCQRPQIHSPRILQPQPDTKLSAAPHMETKAPAQPACTLPMARESHGCVAPSVSCAQPTCGWGVHREPLHPPPTQPISSKGLCPHRCPDSQCTPVSPSVHNLLTAYTLQSALLFTQQLQTSSSLAKPASFSIA